MENLELMLPNSMSVLFTKEEALKSPIYCPECDSLSLQFETFLTAEEMKFRRAELLNSFSLEQPKEIIVFKCTSCEYITDSEKLGVVYFNVIKKKDSLVDIALECNPHEGQAWSARTGFPTEICPINKSPCLSEVWKVCPHIGNSDIAEIIRTSELKVVGEF